MNTITELVEALPEVYQNVYNHPEFDKDSSRNCEIRKNYIIDIVKAFQDKTGKKDLKVLDLGCAQGYYSFSVAELGCLVDGIDFCKENIDLCNALQVENGLSCSYTNDKITQELIENIEDDEYDIIMFYSVVHHIANENGFEYARSLFETLAKKSQIVLTELALKEEPLYWNKNLPEQYDEWFTNVKFYDEQQMFETHLSEYRRPFIVYSNKYCFLKGQFYRIESYKNNAYSDKKEDKNKRYYLCENNAILIKRFSKGVMDEFRNELEREIDILKNYDFSFAPELIDYDLGYNRVINCTSIKYGQLLRDCLAEGLEVDFETLFEKILDNCCELEDKGLYHSDLRSWNISITDNNESFIIDMGAILDTKEDIVLKQMLNYSGSISVFVSFLSLVYDCLIGETYSTIRMIEQYHPSMYFDFCRIPNNFANFIKHVLIVKESDICFRIVREIYKKYVIDKADDRLSIDEEIKVMNHQIWALQLTKQASIDYKVDNYNISMELKQHTSQMNSMSESIQLEQLERKSIAEGYTLYKEQIASQQESVLAQIGILQVSLKQVEETNRELQVSLKQVEETNRELQAEIDSINNLKLLKGYKKITETMGLSKDKK